MEGELGWVSSAPSVHLLSWEAAKRMCCQSFWPDRLQTNILPLSWLPLVLGCLSLEAESGLSWSSLLRTSPLSSCWLSWPPCVLMVIFLSLSEYRWVPCTRSSEQYALPGHSKKRWLGSLTVTLPSPWAFHPVHQLNTHPPPPKAPFSSPILSLDCPSASLDKTTGLMILCISSELHSHLKCVLNNHLFVMCSPSGDYKLMKAETYFYSLCPEQCWVQGKPSKNICWMMNEWMNEWMDRTGQMGWFWIKEFMLYPKGHLILSSPNWAGRESRNFLQFFKISQKSGFDHKKSAGYFIFIFFKKCSLSHVQYTCIL